ncbi:MAG: hypothetical protein ACK5LF_21450 [Bacteroides xylanisolvens]
MIIAVDFDGTLHDGEYPNIGNPIKDAIDVMQKLKYREGHYLIIWTCREGILLTEAINWLLANNIPFDRVNDHEPENKAKYGGTTRKVYAHLYIDDKQVGGLPSWPVIYDCVCKMERDYLERKEKI